MPIIFVLPHCVSTVHKITATNLHDWCLLPNLHYSSSALLIIACMFRTKMTIWGFNSVGRLANLQV